jgi:hypothetical protein
MKSRTEQLSRIMVKPEEQLRREEVRKAAGSNRQVVMTDGPPTDVDDIPLVICPACGEEVPACEAQLNAAHNGWVYFDSRCNSCDTKFRTGEVPERCDLCQQLFRTRPYSDINEFYHHYCREDGHSYCTPCHMQLFFEGYLDLSSDDLGLLRQYDEPNTGAILHDPPWTYIGCTVTPYEYRLAIKGYQEIATVDKQDWGNSLHTLVHICGQIVSRGRRYLILVEGTDIVEPAYRHIVYESQPRADTRVN